MRNQTPRIMTKSFKVTRAGKSTHASTKIKYTLKAIISKYMNV